MGSLVIYHADGSIWGTFPPMIRYSPTGAPIEIIDWEDRERRGLEVTELLRVTTPGDDANPPIKGAKFWPEDRLPWHEYRVELAGEPGKKAIRALVHRKTGQRRERLLPEGETP